MKSYHQVLIRTATPADRFTRQIFDTVCCEGPPLGATGVLDSPTMIVSSHRSHMDYILLGIHCSQLGFRNLRFAAGDNLTSMPYVGRRFTALGAFPVRRSRATSRQYVLELCDQVVAMIEDGDNVIVFPEGGRSYGGAMMEMKTGLVAANVIAQHRSPHKEHYYLPVTVSYEVLPEIRYFGWLAKGRRLRRGPARLVRRATGNLLYYGADLAAFARLGLAPRLGVRYGGVYLDYGEPIRIGAIVDIERIQASEAKHDLFAHKAAVKRVGEEIHRQLTRLYRLLPMHVVAHVLKCGHTQREDITARIPETIGRLQRQNRNCKTIAALSDTELFELGTTQLRNLDAIQLRNGTISMARAEIVDYCAHAIEPPDPGS
jgi:1-acyl-sn-glycerol-3-phosphate acyltransferase